MEPTEVSPPVVTMHLWGVRRAGIVKSLWRMAAQRRAVRRERGVRFAKLLGTGSGETFQIRDADVHHWGLLIAWNALSDARIFEHSSLVSAWDKDAYERARFVMTPIATRGTWSRREPFEPTVPAEPGMQVAAITRARIRPSQWTRFGSYVPSVAAAIAESDGLLLRTGIGEAPIGLQGTFSVWQDADALRSFAYGPEHRLVIDETHRSGWYSEELFARFNVTQATGHFCGVPVGPQ